MDQQGVKDMVMGYASVGSRRGGKCTGTGAVGMRRAGAGKGRGHVLWGS